MFFPHDGSAVLILRKRVNIPLLRKRVSMTPVPVSGFIGDDLAAFFLSGG